MVRSLYIVLFSLKGLLLFGQLDTIVVRDYAKTMVSINRDGSIDPIFDLKNRTEAHLFLLGKQDHLFKVCNSGSTSIWLNGRMSQKLEEGCKFIQFNEQFIDQDTLFLSFYSKAGLVNLRIEELIMEAQESTSLTYLKRRSPRNPVSEFLISGILIIVIFAGVLSFRHPRQMNYLLNGTLNFRRPSSELMNVQFISEAGLSFGFFLSVIIGFLLVIFENLYRSIELQELEFIDLATRWTKLSMFVFGVILAKWIFILLCSRLFRFQKYLDFQLLFFINISTVLTGLIFMGVVLFFIFGNYEQTIMNAGWRLGIFVMISLSQLFFWLKFVNNTTRNKLLIISYLCATEFMPFTVMAGWFFK